MKDYLPIAVKRNGNAACSTTSQSSLRDASSPGRKDSLRPEGDVANSDRGRMTTGESVAAVLNERSFHFQKQPGSAVSIHDCLPCAPCQSAVPQPLPIRTGPGTLRPIGPKRTVGLARPAQGSPTRGAVEP